MPQNKQVVQKIVIVMFGPPCSGKSKMGALLAETLGFERVVTSDLLREHREDAHGFIRSGNVASDDIMVPLLEAYAPRAGGVIIDSLRSPAQVHWLKRWAPAARIYTFHFEVSESTIFRRLDYASSTERGARPDDANICHRLREYQRYSKETFGHLNGITILETIDAERSFEEVSEEIFKILSVYGVVSEPA